jgi:hypothetical protein
MPTRKFLLTLTVSLLAAIAAFAQWPARLTRGVPMKDGKMNPDAPAPRMSDGKVDFTGLWENVRGAVGTGPGAKGKDKGKQPPPPALSASGLPQATFWDIGANLSKGLPLQPWAKQLKDQRMAENSKDNPDAHCLPMGLMQYHLHPQPRKMIQTQDVVVMLYEANSGIRQIFLDGRPNPPKDVLPWWFGYSAGRWEDKDTLVVETTMLRDLGWLDVNGSPITTEGKIIERYRRPSFGRLEIEVTIDDPKAYSAPFTVGVSQRIMPDDELIEFICAENERSEPHLVGK